MCGWRSGAAMGEDNSKDGGGRSPWSAAQALAVLCTEDPAFADGLDVSNSLAVDLSVFFRGGSGQHVTRDRASAENILLAALKSGAVTATGIPLTGGARETIPLSATKVRERIYLMDWPDDIVLFSDVEDRRWQRLLFEPHEIESLVIANRPVAPREEHRTAWAHERQRPFLSLSSAARLVMALTSPNGDDLAVIVHGPGWDWFDHPSSVREVHGDVLAELFDDARRAWTETTAAILLKLQLGQLIGIADDDIRPAQWSRYPVDWWASSLGASLTDIRIERAALETAFQATNPTSSPEIPGLPTTPRNPGLTAVSPKERGPGAPATYEWDEIDAEIMRRLVANDRLSKTLNRSKLGEDVQAWCTERWDREPGKTQMAKHVNAVSKKYEERKSGNSGNSGN